MNVSLYIAKRYLRSKSSNNAINFITYIAIIGVILGSASLFVVLSGFAGLKDFTLQFTSQVDPDLKAETTLGKSFVLTEEETLKLDALRDIASYSKIIEERVFLAVDDKNSFAVIKGVDEHFQHVVAIDSTLDHGSWFEQKSNQLVLGWGISNSLSLGVLDFSKPISVYVPKPGKSQITPTKNAFNTVKAISVGVFNINEQLNDAYVYAPIDLARNLLNYKPNQFTALEFKLNNGVDETQAKANIKAILGDKVILKNRAQLNDALYKMLNTENLAVYLIFTLVLIIAFFNVIGSLIMMMLDKKRSLNTLFNIGATVKDIKKIFFYQGSLMSIVGGIIGLILALIITGLQKAFSLVMITPTLAYPVTIKFENIILVFLTISVLGVVASKIASARITKSLVKGF
ncbi:FtsX-like permease family protein [Algibacter amylolyticus]|uniref:FtsX-like permease family protein n=1 Tax=Algibacter amylolyticus TaxID=1608400 RepID=A0A5M7BII9_9FLAO|nr:FtsX-like permease family protein [Algibacter amylolyticus]KAA5827494.1 FtsX-like permease family protein [Algibacter amylolyticus]MBB5266693.1 lipoprotein-releasing system permease protein [Algibacter amylolyticus]TSJ81739.1 FtsX-like permease family protein [Algibacter amylolyticus]